MSDRKRIGYYIKESNGEVCEQCGMPTMVCTEFYDRGLQLDQIKLRTPAKSEGR